MDHKSTANQKGFTLVELVMVIVILGILAAVVMPKFLSMGKDARQASINTAAGAFKSAANTAYLKCQTQPACDATAATSSFTDNGVSYKLVYGYPDGSASATNGIKTLVDTSGFDVDADASGNFRLKLKTSPDPANCAVIYTNATSATVAATQTTTTTGC